MEAVLRDIKSGLVASTACIAFAVANGALIYSGALQPMLSRGIAAGLLTTTISCIVLALLSGIKPAVATANAAVAAPLGAIAASIAPALEQLSPGDAVATLSALVAVTTVATGGLLLLLGSGRLGDVVRFVPQPVVAGFMGVTGTLLILGAVRFVTGVPVLWRTLPQLVAQENGMRLAAAVIFAAAVALVTRRIRHPLTLPVLLVVGIVGTDLVAHFAALSGTSVSDSWFLAPQNPTPLVVPVLFDPSATVAWDAIWPHLPAIAAFGLLVTMSVLLGSISLETALNAELDFDRELRAQGTAVVASGLIGGFVGTTSLGSTLAGVASGARGRVTGLMTGFAALVVLLWGRPLLPFIPTFVIGGVLLEIGRGTVVNWCFATRKQMSRGEWLLVIGIVAVTIQIGLVAGVGVGVLGGCVLFALDLSRIDIVRRQYGLDQWSSTVARSNAELAMLARDGSHVQVVELSGTLFFGSAYQILAHVRRLLRERSPLLIVLDLTGVVGGDGSTTAILSRMRRVLGERDVAFGIAGGAPALVALLRAAGALRESDAVYATRDGALEAGENLILARRKSAAASKPMIAWLTDALNDDGSAEALLPYFVAQDFAVGEHLCRQGEPTTSLLFIESGRVAVVIDAPGREQETVVRVLGPGTIAGEQAFVLGLPRTATLRAEERTRTWALDKANFDTLSTRRPDLVIALLRDIVRLQAERLAFASRQSTLAR